jgi:hypothetical protein
VNYNRSYRLLILLLGISCVLGSCNTGGKRMNKRVTFWRNDKIPYGTWYAYQEISHIFPDATVTINKKSPDKYKALLLKEVNKSVEEELNYDNNKTAYIIISSQVVPDDNEVAALLSQVAQGQNVFISSLRFGETLLDSLRLKTAFYTSIYNVKDSLTVSVNNPVTEDSMSYSYPGFALDNYITEMDSSITTILGKDQFGHANFVRFSYDGGGSLYIHLAPTALTNFFLLHKQNKAYYDHVLSYLPKNIEVVRWDDYFRYHERGAENPGSNFSALGWIMKQPSLAAAFWLLLLLLLLIYLFESKRKQRIIPEIAPLKNASLDFVKTIGRLYFQRRDNQNLAQKMTAHFMDHVRSRYSIRASLSDPEFENRLSWKTGYDMNALKDLLYHIKMVQDEPSVSDERLLELNRKLEHFYKYA